MRRLYEAVRSDLHHVVPPHIFATALFDSFAVADDYGFYDLWLRGLTSVPSPIELSVVDTLISYNTKSYRSSGRKLDCFDTKIPVPPEY
jgi:hypothetical protein